MADAPVTLEGWYTLHDMFTVDWGRWNAIDDAERASIVAEADAVLARLASPPSGATAVYTLVSQKGDLCVMHWRPTLEALREAEVALARTRLRGFLVPVYSYLAVIELGTYELMGHAAGLVKKRGLEPGHDEFEAAVKAEMEKMARPRLFPEVPARRYVCFYPMSKRRGEQVNWYDLPAAERAAFMRGHGEIGRKYAGQVTQVIQGSVGLDDWEWGVTLFADDPVVFKKLVYEMRFDPASSRFALFGSFWVGMRCVPGGLGAALGATS